MLATLSLVIRHEALARRGETIYKKSPMSEDRGLSCFMFGEKKKKMVQQLSSSPFKEREPTFRNHPEHEQYLPR